SSPGRCRWRPASSAARTLPAHHALAMLLVAALGEVVLQHRGRRLLGLQKQRVVLIATLQQGDEGPRADAAHPDDLASGVDELEPFEQAALVVAERGPVGGGLLEGR